jgi:hypothetical protein
MRVGGAPNRAVDAYRDRIASVYSVTFQRSIGSKFVRTQTEGFQPEDL